MSAIDTSDVVFAWIENTTCYGTLAEIGYAHGAGKTIWIAGPSHFPDLWFTYQLAHQVLFSPTFTPKEAFKLCLLAAQSKGEPGLA